MKKLLLQIVVSVFAMNLNAQNVGIGTSSPASLLDVSASQPDSRITFTNNASFGRLVFAQAGTISSTIQHVGSTYAIANRQNALEIFNITPTGPLSFWTNATERMRITSDGDFGIGIISPLYKLHVIETTAGGRTIWAENTHPGTGGSNGTGVYGRSVNGAGFGYGVVGDGGLRGVTGSSTGAYSGTTFGVWGSATGSLGTKMGVYGDASGGAANYGVYCNGSGGYTGTWTLISDQKFKRDIVTVNDALGLIIQLNPVSYQLKKDDYPMMNFPEFRQYGFVAQELEKVIPLLVENGTHPGANKDEDIKLKSVNYIGMIPILTKAIQEQQQVIDDQKKQLEKMRAQIEDLAKAVKLLSGK